MSDIQIIDSSERRKTKDSLTEAYFAWKKNPTPENLRIVLEAAKPIIVSGIRSYAGNAGRLVESRAKLLAIDAIKRYSPAQGTSLRTYILLNMRPLTRIAQSRNSVVPIPERIRIDQYRLMQLSDEFREKYGREPSVAELSDMSGLSVKRVRKVLSYGRGIITESTASEGSDDDTRGELPATIKRNPQERWADAVWHDLDPIGQKIMEWRTGYDGSPILPVNEIAKRLKISSSAVSQRANTIAKKLEEVDLDEFNRSQFPETTQTFDVGETSSKPLDAFASSSPLDDFSI